MRRLMIVYFNFKTSGRLTRIQNVQRNVAMKLPLLSIAQTIFDTSACFEITYHLTRTAGKFIPNVIALRNKCEPAMTSILSRSD